MREVSREFAQYLFFSNQELYGLRTNGTEALIEEIDDIYAFNLYGVE